MHGGLPVEVVHAGVETAPGVIDPLRSAAKRGIDIALALLGVLAVAPVLGVLMLAIRLESPGPALYRQTRVGRSGRTFQILKLRTMHVDAEKAQEQAWADGAEHGCAHKCPSDPRVTRVGSFLRRSSLDEVPQLANVLRGEMSLVGPRPLQPVEVDRLSPHERRRHLVKPGITGLWQVSGRSRTTWDERMELDLRYVEQGTLRQDLRILLRTVGAVVRQEGAY